MRRSLSVMLVCGWGSLLLMHAPVEARGREEKRNVVAAGEDLCARECQSQAQRVYNECRDNGGSRQECVRRSHRYLHECWNDCVTPPTCDEVCEVRAQRVLAAPAPFCGASANPAEQARRLLRRLQSRPLSAHAAPAAPTGP